MTSRRSKKVTVLKKFLPFIVALMLVGCAASATQMDQDSSPQQKECLFQCQNGYSSCSLKCEEIHREGSGMDFCLQQCDDQLAECEGQCSQQGKGQ